MLGKSRDTIITETTCLIKECATLREQEEKKLSETLTKYNFAHPSEIANAYPSHEDILPLAASINTFHQIIEAGLPSTLNALTQLNLHFQNDQNEKLQHLDKALLPEVFIPLETLAHKKHVLEGLRKDNHQSQCKHEIAIERAEKKVANLKKDNKEGEDFPIATIEVSQEEKEVSLKAQERLRKITLLHTPKITFCKQLNEEYEKQLATITKELSTFNELLEAPALLLDYFETILSYKETYTKLTQCNRDLQSLAFLLEKTPRPDDTKTMNKSWEKSFSESEEEFRNKLELFQNKSKESNTTSEEDLTAHTVNLDNPSASYVPQLNATTSKNSSLPTSPAPTPGDPAVEPENTNTLSNSFI